MAGIIPGVDSRTGGGLLTPREVEVVALIRAGRTNEQIASTLVISPSTAAHHVHNIIAKLGCSNRAEVAAWGTSHPALGAPSVRRRDHGVFVGRERELAQLQDAFDAASGGNGGIVMLAGEPGIGKTRLVQELERYARERGGNVLWGRNHEDSGAPPYWPWVEVGREWTETNGMAALRSADGVADGGLSPLFPELRSRRATARDAPTPDGDGARFRLFDAFTGLVRMMASAGPLVLVLEDLHWADNPTLLLLRHIARDLDRLSVLVVGTYRDTAVPGAHPLGEVVASINSEADFRRLTLGGLSKGNVADYIQGTTDASPGPAMLEKIFAKTEGNPFFLREVLNLLRASTTQELADGAEIPMPEGVRDALGKHLHRLSPEARGAAEAAAIIGREFSYELVASILPAGLASTPELIDECVEGWVFEETERPGHYRFVHALMQETLLSQLSTARQATLHGEVGEALEQRWGDRCGEIASRLSMHFSESAPFRREHLSKACRYSFLAGERAGRQYAWREARACYEHCLALHGDAHGAIGEDIAPVLLAIAETGWHTATFDTVKYSTAAAELYRSRGDTRGLARATFAIYLNPSMYLSPTLEPRVEEALAALGDGDDALTGALLGVLLETRYIRNPRLDTDADAEFVRAKSLLAELPQIRLESSLSAVRATIAHEREEFELARVEHISSARAAERAGQSHEAALQLWQAGLCMLWPGRLDEAARDFENALSFARERRAAWNEGAILNAIGRIGLLRGDPIREARLDEAGPPGARAFAQARRAEAVGEFRPFIELFDAWVTPARENATNHASRPVVEGTIARLLFLAGDVEAAAARFATWRAVFHGGYAAWEPLNSTGAIEAVDEALVALGDSATWTLALDRLTVLSEYRLGTNSGWGLDHVRGDLARALGRSDEARHWYEIGVEWATRERVAVEAGKCREGLANLARDRGDDETAAWQAEQAAALFEGAGATFYLQRLRTAFGSVIANHGGR